MSQVRVSIEALTGTQAALNTYTEVVNEAAKVLHFELRICERELEPFPALTESIMALVTQARLNAAEAQRVRHRVTRCIPPAVAYLTGDRGFSSTDYASTPAAAAPAAAPAPDAHAPSAPDSERAPRRRSLRSAIVDQQLAHRKEAIRRYERAAKYASGSGMVIWEPTVQTAARLLAAVCNSAALWHRVQAIKLGESDGRDMSTERRDLRIAILKQILGMELGYVFAHIELLEDAFRSFFPNSDLWDRGEAMAQLLQQKGQDITALLEQSLTYSGGAPKLLPPTTKGLT